jgi:Ca2+/H+ antiporter
MAQVTNTNQKAKLTPNPSGKTVVNNSQKPPLFRKTNYILMIIGVVLLVIGLFCLAGGAASSPDEFNPEVFSTRRIVVAPIVILLGLVTEIFAIMWRPKVKQSENEEKAE